MRARNWWLLAAAVGVAVALALAIYVYGGVGASVGRSMRGEHAASSVPHEAPPAVPTVAPTTAPEVAGAALPDSIDLEALQARLPGNRYWELGAPTDDPALLEQRANAARQGNLLYGKILSGTATEEEIDGYFEERRQLLSDYAALARAILDDDRISERDRGRFQLALDLDQARLGSLPRERADALARKRQQDEKRAAWRAAGN